MEKNQKYTIDSFSRISSTNLFQEAQEVEKGLNIKKIDVGHWVESQGWYVKHPIYIYTLPDTNPKKVHVVRNIPSELDNFLFLGKDSVAPALTNYEDLSRAYSSFFNFCSGYLDKALEMNNSSLKEIKNYIEKIEILPSVLKENKNLITKESAIAFVGTFSTPRNGPYFTQASGPIVDIVKRIGSYTDYSVNYDTPSENACFSFFFYGKKTDYDQAFELHKIALRKQGFSEILFHNIKK